MERPYEQLTSHETLFVDDQVRAMMLEGKKVGVKLAGDDDCERAVDALSEWVIKSR